MVFRAPQPQQLCYCWCGNAKLPLNNKGSTVQETMVRGWSHSAAPVLSCFVNYHSMPTVF